MIEQLPIPIFTNSHVYSSVDVVKPKAGVLADSQKIAKSGDVYSSINNFVWGCCEAVIDENENAITDRVQLKSIVRSMPYRSAEVVAIKSMLQYDSDDGVEGVYYCPRCGQQVLAQYEEEEGEVLIDTRDRIGDLAIKYMDGQEETVIHQFSTPIDIRNAATKDIIEQVSWMELKHPTLNHCMSAWQRHGQKDDLRMQCGIYIEALTKINNQPVDQQWKNKYGMLAFENIVEIKSDLMELSKKIYEYGIDRRVDKECPKCGKHWRALVNTSNFFELGVGSM